MRWYHNINLIQYTKASVKVTRYNNTPTNISCNVSRVNIKKLRVELLELTIYFKHPVFEFANMGVMI